MTGRVLGHYEILEKLGEGGMGAVYNARDVRLNRLVAIKFLSAGRDSADQRARFVREAQAASALNQHRRHPRRLSRPRGAIPRHGVRRG